MLKRFIFWLKRTYLKSGTCVWLMFQKGAAGKKRPWKSDRAKTAINQTKNWKFFGIYGQTWQPLHPRFSQVVADENCLFIMWRERDTFAFLYGNQASQRKAKSYILCAANGMVFGISRKDAQLFVFKRCKVFL